MVAGLTSSIAFESGTNGFVVSDMWHECLPDASVNLQSFLLMSPEGPPSSVHLRYEHLCHFLQHFNRRDSLSSLQVGYVYFCHPSLLAHLSSQLLLPLLSCPARGACPL